MLPIKEIETVCGAHMWHMYYFSSHPDVYMDQQHSHVCDFHIYFQLDHWNTQSL